MNYYAFHIGDYASATRHLTWDEDAAYRRLLDAYYVREAPLPLEARQVYRLVAACSDEQRIAVDTILAEFFIKTDEGYRHRRCDAELAKVKEKKDKASNSASARWNKGNANAQADAANASAEQANAQNVNANACQSECEGNAPNPNPNPNPNPKEKKRADAPFVLPGWIPKEAWDEFVKMRAKRRVANTPYALRLVVAELERQVGAGQGVQALLDQSTKRSWTDIYPLKQVDTPNGKTLEQMIAEDPRYANH